MRFALQSINPKLADDLPKSIDLALLKLKERDFATPDAWSSPTSIRWLGIVAPLTRDPGAARRRSLLAPDRRVGVLRAALAVAAAGAVIAIVYLILRARILAGVIGSDEVTDAGRPRRGRRGSSTPSSAACSPGGSVLALLGLVVAGAAAALDPERTEDPVTAAPAA